MGHHGVGFLSPLSVRTSTEVTQVTWSWSPLILSEILSPRLFTRGDRTNNITVYAVSHREGWEHYRLPNNISDRTSNWYLQNPNDYSINSTNVDS